MCAVPCLTAAAIQEDSVGDKSPKSKQRDQKQKTAAKGKVAQVKKDTAAAASQPPKKK